MNVQCDGRRNSHVICGTVRYTALIRTFNSENTLSATVESLLQQTAPPERFVFVDSGSTDGTLSCVPDGSLVRRFVGEQFNYADALNQGLQDVATDCVLIISSHTALARADAVEYALGLLRRDESLGAAYFCHENSGTLRYDRIDETRFDGFNGLWNTCAIIKTKLLRLREFNPDVFTAEDQEWSRWLLQEQGKAIARISGGGMTIRNERPNRREKRLNEYVSVAYFTNRRLLGWRNLAAIASKAVAPSVSQKADDRLFWLILFWRLLVCRFVRPRYRSRYF